MIDPMSMPVTRCPWCSAPLSAPGGESCSECGATLTAADGSEPQLPGVTTIDAQAILRARSEAARPRSRFLSFITGEAADEAGSGSAASVAPPSDEVRREMRRLEMDAARAELEAEVSMLQAQAALEGRLPTASERLAPETSAADAHGAATDPEGPEGAPSATDAEPPEDRSAL